MMREEVRWLMPWKASKAIWRCGVSSGPEDSGKALKRTLTSFLSGRVAPKRLTMVAFSGGAEEGVGRRVRSEEVGSACRKGDRSASLCRLLGHSSATVQSTHLLWVSSRRESQELPADLDEFESRDFCLRRLLPSNAPATAPAAQEQLRKHGNSIKLPFSVSRCRFERVCRRRRDGQDSPRRRS